jgi:hypothetical protein
MQATADVKARCARIVTTLQKIASDSDATFADPRSVFLDLILCGHEIDAAEFAMRKTHWPIGSHP